MPNKRPSKKSAKRVSRVSAPKWKRDGFRSYRAYLNERYKSLGFKSYSEYSTRRAKGEVASTKGLARAPKGTARPKFEVTHKQLRNIAGLERIGFDSQCPIRYTINERVPDIIERWIRDFAAKVKHAHAGQIYSASWRIFGQAAQSLDEETGLPIWNRNEWEEWSSHMEFDKAINLLVSTARAYANHDFIQSGRFIGRGASVIFALLITRVRISVVLIKGT